MCCRITKALESLIFRTKEHTFLLISSFESIQASALTLMTSIKVPDGVLISANIKDFSQRSAGRLGCFYGFSVGTVWQLSQEDTSSTI